MTEPQDRAVPGVASVLIRLRTRTGLREERLRDTQVDLNALADLPRVQELKDAGETPERAIVHAVLHAVKALTPTMRIIADVSLCLRLFADQVTEGDLYADDLRERREALLRNWGRLHELESVSPGKPPSLGVLRLSMESEALTALAAALTTSVGTGRSPQAPARVNEPGTSDPWPDDDTTSPDLRTVLRIFRDVGQTLRDRVIRNDDGVPTGWQQNLDGPGKEATAVSTAYGIRTMLLLEDGLAADLILVAENLKKMAHDGGGYASSGHKEPSVEATAAVLNALGRIAVTEDFGAHIRQMDRGLTDFEKTRPFILTTMLEASLLLKEGGDLVEKLVACLLAARRPDGGRLVWSENSDRKYAEPSVAHTARAVRALANVRAIWADRELDEPVGQAVDWLLEQRNLHNNDETIERVPPVGTYHFTAAWVVKALISADVPATDPAVRNAVSLVWDSYVGDKGDKDVALWRSHRGDLPIWTTFDAIEALRLANWPLRPGPGLCPPPTGRRDVTGLMGPSTIVW